MTTSAGSSGPLFVMTPPYCLSLLMSRSLFGTEKRNSRQSAERTGGFFWWIQQNRHLVSSRAHVSFLLTWVSANAIEQGDRSAYWPLLKEAFRRGSPSALDKCVFVGIWLIPQGLRRWFASCLSATRHR